MLNQVQKSKVSIVISWKLIFAEQEAPMALDRSHESRHMRR